MSSPFDSQNFYLSLFLCFLHDILFISVDSLNDTIAANLSDTDIYGGELYWSPLILLVLQ